MLWWRYGLLWKGRCLITALEAKAGEVAPVVGADRAPGAGRSVLEAGIVRAGLAGAEVVRIEVRSAGLDRAEPVGA